MWTKVCVVRASRIWLVGGLFENICFEKIGCLNGLLCCRGFREAITNQGLVLGMQASCLDLGLEMAFFNCVMPWVSVFLLRRIAPDLAHTELLLRLRCSVQHSV